MGRRNKKYGSILSIFMHADAVDMLLMILGFIGAVGDGLSTPAMLFVTSKLMNNVGSTISPKTSGHDFTHDINKNALALCYLAAAQWIASFLEGYCWTRTGERQASRLRARYLKAVLRQDVGYFDLHVTSTAEVITCVSNDTLVIQDVISEKVPVFLMNASIFFGAYNGRTLTGIARKMRVEYNKADAITEQAISSIRTVYSFVGEKRIVSDYSAALEGTVKLGLRQGLAKGLAVGSNGVVFGIWSFMSYYGSRMVMYNNAQGGTTLQVGSCIIVGGLGLWARICSKGHYIREHRWYECWTSHSLVFTSRPWKDYSTVVVMQSFLDSIVNPEGWLEFEGAGSGRDSTVYYAEFDNNGPGSATDGRVKWPGYHIITDSSDVEQYSVANFIAGESRLPDTGVPFDSGI